METRLNLPIIDFSGEDLNPGTPEWESVKTQVGKAVEKYGCFEALFDKVPLELRKQIMSAMEELFDLPLEAKLRNISDVPFHGYIGQSPLVPLFESMGIENPNILEKVDSTVTTAFWPQGNPSFSKTIQSFSEQLSELDQKVRRMIVESLGLEKYLEEHMKSTDYILRVMKYKAPGTTERAEVGLTPHTDKNTVTILYRNQVGGLQMQAEGGEWISVKPSTSHSFIVLVGESLFAWANGRIHTPVHRVMMTGNEARYSAGLFSYPKPGYIIKAPEEVVDEEHPLLFKPFDHAEFIKFFYSKRDLLYQSALMAYAAIDHHQH